MLALDQDLRSHPDAVHTELDLNGLVLPHLKVKACFQSEGDAMISRLRNHLLPAFVLSLCASLAFAAASSGQIPSEASDGVSAANLPFGVTFGLGSQTGPADSEPLRGRIGGVRIPFVANRGQADPAVAYYASTFAGTVYVTKKGEIVYSLPAAAKEAKKNSRQGARTSGRTVGKGWSLTETAVGGKARVVAEQPAVAQVSYFIGNDPTRWRSGIATYETVGLGEVWPGVRLSLRAHGDNVEKLFTVEPGADPSRIRMRVAGARSLRVNQAGALVAKTGFGEVAFTRPVAYQEHDGVRRDVTVAYRAKGRQYSFSVSGHDPALPVVIDPLLQATYLGGSSGDFGWALAIHPTTGEVFVAGGTGSADFPGTSGGAQAFGGSGDAFVARFNATLTALVQATYLGGSGSDEISVGGSALAIHPTTGEVFIAGGTSSPDFPGTAGGAQPANAGGADAFVARLDATLTTLSQATYLGGSGADVGYALAIHPTTGEVFVALQTQSTDLPGTAGGAQPAIGGFSDAFVARLDATLTALSQATYLGGSHIETPFDLAIYPTSGEVFVTGRTLSADFPGTAGGAQPLFGGLADAFVARLDATLTTLIQATYLGGSGADSLSGLAIHPSTGEVFVVGTGFPRVLALGRFVARLNPTLTTLNQAADLHCCLQALAIHPTTGEVFVAGWTDSPLLPGTAGGAQPTYGGGDSDAFVARLTSDLMAPVVNELVTLSPVVTSFDPTPVDGGPAGTFTITATFTNTSSNSIHDPVFKVTQLSGENLLLNADGGPGGVGAFLTPDVGPDAVLSPGESLTVGFVIGLQVRARFTFFVDLLGVPEP